MDITKCFHSYLGSANCDYIELRVGETKERPFPILRDASGRIPLYSVGPEHGRSYVVGLTKSNRYIISKGNGLCYTSLNFIDTKEFGTDIWGLLLEADAIRDYTICREVEALGIKTNHMEYVLQLNYPLNLYDSKGNTISPTLLQYDVECPYRISDFGFMPKSVLHAEVSKWEGMNKNNMDEKYLIAADILIRNLNIMHSHNILHNAISVQNYTWALELLDFELSSSPSFPYSDEDYERHKCILYNREIIHTYQVILYIARVLDQDPDFNVIDDVFLYYGFDLSKFNITKLL